MFKYNKDATYVYRGKSGVTSDTIKRGTLYTIVTYKRHQFCVSPRVIWKISDS